MTFDPMSLFRLDGLTPEEEALFRDVVAAISFPLRRCIPAVANDRDGAVLVKSADLGNGVDGRWTGRSMEIHLDIDSPNIATNIVHEVGHMVDACVLDPQTREDLMDLMERPDNVRGSHVEHPRDWFGRGDGHVEETTYRMRYSEAFADAFVYHYARDLWDAGTNWKTRFHHFVSDAHRDAFHQLLMRSVMTLPIDRLAGPSRIETAVAVSQHRFPDGADVVYIATGDNWPDTISAGALAVDGPLLLVSTVGPAHSSVKDEVTRLAPSRIVAVGGSAVVPQDVLVELGEIRE